MLNKKGWPLLRPFVRPGILRVAYRTLELGAAPAARTHALHPAAAGLHVPPCAWTRPFQLNLTFLPRVPQWWNWSQRGGWGPGCEELVLH